MRSPAWLLVTSLLVTGPAMTGPVVTCLGNDSSATAAEVATEVTSPPADVVAHLRLDSGYRKHAFAGPFSVVASERVPDAGLQEAVWLIEQMLVGREDILKVLAQERIRFVVMAHDEMTTDVPEHRDLEPKSYWDRRARGLGATPHRPAVSCGVENLLSYPGDPYHAENILIHEFAHAIHLVGLRAVDPTFDGRLKVAFEAAMAEGLWKGKYAAQNRQEYWAEGVQSWFDTNRENDNDHNHVNTRSEIREYDPRLAVLLEEVFGDREWRYTRPETRASLPHLKSWKFSDAPRFAWPDHLPKSTGRTINGD